MMSRLIIIFSDGLWNVVRADARTVVLFSSTSATVAAEWRDQHAVHVRVAA